MHVVVKYDLRDFRDLIGVEILQGRDQLVGVGVLAVDDEHDLLALADEIIDILLDPLAGVGDPRDVLEDVAVLPVEKRQELFVVEKNIAVVARIPVYIHLIGIPVAIRVEQISRRLRALNRESVRHYEELAYIVPVDPDREELAAVIYPVADIAVYFNYVIDRQSVLFLYYREPLHREVVERVERHKVA